MLTKTVEDEKEQLTFLCISCNLSQVGERGEECTCNHCGGGLKIQEEPEFFL